MRAWNAANPTRTKEIARRSRITNKEKDNLRSKEWRRKNMDKKKAAWAAWRLAHPEQTYNTNRAWRLANVERVKSMKTKWRENNRGRLRASLMARKESVKRATPRWSEPFFFEEAHDLAVRRELFTGIKWHVDHIEPINGRDVCGLHVPANIRVIPASLNTKKHSNRVTNPHWLGFDDGRKCEWRGTA